MSKKSDKRAKYLLVKEHGTYVNIVAAEIELKPIMDILLSADVPIIVVTTIDTGFGTSTTYICISKHNYDKYFVGSNVYVAAATCSEEFALIDVFGRGHNAIDNKVGIWKLMKMFESEGVHVDVIMSGPKVYITVPMSKFSLFKIACSAHS